MRRSVDAIGTELTPFTVSSGTVTTMPSLLTATRPPTEKRPPRPLLWHGCQRRRWRAGHVCRGTLVSNAGDERVAVRDRCRGRRVHVDRVVCLGTRICVTHPCLRLTGRLRRRTTLSYGTAWRRFVSRGRLGRGVSPLVCATSRRTSRELVRPCTRLLRHLGGLPRLVAHCTGTRGSACGSDCTCPRAAGVPRRHIGGDAWRAQSLLQSALDLPARATSTRSS